MASNWSDWVPPSAILITDPQQPKRCQYSDLPDPNKAAYMGIFKWQLSGQSWCHEFMTVSSSALEASMTMTTTVLTSTTTTMMMMMTTTGRCRGG